MTHEIVLLQKLRKPRNTLLRHGHHTSFSTLSSWILFFFLDRHRTAGNRAPPTPPRTLENRPNPAASKIEEISTNGGEKIGKSYERDEVPTNRIAKCNPQLNPSLPSSGGMINLCTLLRRLDPRETAPRRRGSLSSSNRVPREANTHNDSTTSESVHFPLFRFPAPFFLFTSGVF